jgi:hypothetical protein
MSRLRLIQTSEEFLTIVRAFLPGCYIRFHHFRKKHPGQYEGYMAYFGNSSFIGAIFFSTRTFRMGATIRAHERIRPELIPHKIYIGSSSKSLINFLKLYKYHGGFRPYTREEVKFIRDKLLEVEKIDLSAIEPYKKFTT